MMYTNKVAAVIKANGRVLRERSGKVLIPFGTEYSVLVKNLNSVRIKFQLSIDGENALSNNWIVVPANSSVEIERFIRGGNKNEGNKFKFIERTDKIEEHRGAKADDGLVRIEFKTEKIIRVEHVYHQHHHYDWPRPQRYDWSQVWQNTGTLCGAQNSGSTQNSGVLRSASLNSTGMRNGCGAAINMTGLAMACSADAVRANPGITAPGSRSDQKFVDASWFDTEEHSDVMVLQLQGIVNGQDVKAPVTVKFKPICETCGMTSKPSNAFCGHCGTALVLY